jgi:hypothetical protein
MGSVKRRNRLAARLKFQRVVKRSPVQLPCNFRRERRSNQFPPHRKRCAMAVDTLAETAVISRVASPRLWTAMVTPFASALSITR